MQFVGQILHIPMNPWAQDACSPLNHTLLPSVSIATKLEETEYDFLAFFLYQSMGIRFADLKGA